MLAGLLWAYWSTLSIMATRWAVDPMYSHGFVVPFVAGGLLWLRRDQFVGMSFTPSWWGLSLLLAGIGCRLGATHFYFEWFDALSLLPCLAGICLLTGGWPAIRAAWPAIVLLGFMVPLPFTLETAAAAPLQGFATKASTFLIQTLGYPAVAEGHSIAIADVTIDVAQACSGLRMLVVFVAAATATAFFSKRSNWEQLLIIVSAVPIALFGNVIRITATGVLHEVAGAAMADLVFHDLAGWLMMLLAVALLRCELWFLDQALVEVPDRERVPVMPGSQRFNPAPPTTTQSPRTSRMSFRTSPPANDEMEYEVPAVVKTS